MPVLFDEQDFADFLGFFGLGFFGGPEPAGDGGVANCGIPAASWGMERGIKYVFESDETKEGLGHGRALTGTSLLRDTAGFSRIWRSPPVTPRIWTDLGAISADVYGHWVSPISLWEVATYDGTAPDDVQRYVYGIGVDANNVTEIGEVYTREYIAHDAELGKDCALCVCWSTYWIRMYCDGTNLRLQRRGGVEFPWESIHATIDAGGVAYDPWITKAGGGLMMICWRTGTGAEAVYHKLLSYDDGVSTFQPPTSNY